LVVRPFRPVRPSDLVADLTEVIGARESRGGELEGGKEERRA
jgi:hypothetical protein